jgi:hypothetical protein
MAFPYPYTGPIAPYNNLPINAQYYQPNRFNISALTIGTNTTVTTSVNNNYVIGQLVRFIIPQQFGTYQLNEQKGYVTAINSPTQFVVNLNSSRYDTFVPTPTRFITQAQILAIGDINTGATNASGRVNNGTFIPGSFINISPL